MTPTEGGEADDSAIRLEVEGVSWEVSEVGSGRSGTGWGRGARLILLRFSTEGADGPPREALVVGSSLGELDPDEIRVAFGRAKPRRSPPSKPTVPDVLSDDLAVSD